MRNIFLAIFILVAITVKAQLHKVNAVAYGPLTTAQVQALPARLQVDGTIVFNSTTESLWVYLNSQWNDLGTPDLNALGISVTPGVNNLTDVQSVLEDHEARILNLASGGSDGVISNVTLSGTSLDFTGTGGGFNSSLDLSSLQDGTGTDSQTLSILSNSLSISNGNSVSLSPYLDNTDEQDLSLSGTILSLSGDPTSVDLSSFAGTDSQTLSSNGSSGNVSISGGNSININVDDNDSSVTNEIQDLSLSGNVLSLSGDATTVDLSSFIGTDSQSLSTNSSPGNISISNGNTITLNINDADSSTTNEIQDLSLSGTTLSLSGDATTVDLSILQDGIGTDSQTLSISSNSLSISNGNSVSLLPYLDNTDEQDLSLSGTILSLSGDPTSVDLSSFAGTDSQNLSTNNSPGNISISGGNSITLNVNDADSSVTNEIQDLSLLGTTLSLSGDATTVDLSVLQDGIGTDSQTLTTDSTPGNISIAGGNTVTLNVNDTDFDATNEIQDLSLSGNTLSLSGDASSVSLAGYLDNTDSQSLSLNSSTLSISGGNSVDLSSLQDGTGTDSQTLSFSSPNLSISGGNSVDLSSLQDGVGISNISEDTTPQLGGNLDNAGFDITGSGAISTTAQIRGGYYLLGNLTNARTWQLSRNAVTDQFSIFVENGDNTDLYTTVATLQSTGVPTISTDLITKSYADSNYANDNQTLFYDLFNKELSISNGNSVSLPFLTSWSSVNGNVLPIINKAYSLGDSSLRFAQIYGNNLDISGSGYFFDAKADQFILNPISTPQNIQSGAIYYNSDTDQFLGYANNQWIDLGVQSSSSGIANVVEDTTPQLGGTLDLNSNTISGAGTIDLSGTLEAWHLQLGNSTIIRDYQFLSNSSAGLRLMIESGSNTGVFDQRFLFTPDGTLQLDRTIVSEQLQLVTNSAPSNVQGVVYYNQTSDEFLGNVDGEWVNMVTGVSVVNTPIFYMSGHVMFNNRDLDSGPFTFFDCDPGEELTVYINQANPPTLSGTGLTFNELPSSVGFSANTEMAIHFLVAYDGTTIDYYYYLR